jgi:replicative DNA helicase
MYRDDYYDPSSADRGTVELIVAKNRDGETRTLRLAWIPALTRFCDIMDV